MGFKMEQHKAQLKQHEE
uniref:Uncharacterized protein n=1 Tax=Arundo donax TaxID=35708 RepID=A0A0A9EYN9_ARUDO